MFMLRKLFSSILFCGKRFTSGFFVRKMKLDSNQEYVLLVDEARKEWQWANNLIQEYKEEYLIDQAIYWQSATERRYIHLLKQAAREGIKADPETIVSLALSARNKVYGGWRHVN